MPKKLATKLSLENLWGEMVYTLARLKGDADAADFAALIAPYISEIEETSVGQRRMWTAEIEAQAQCDYLNGLLDNLVDETADTLIFANRDRNAVRVKRYLRQAPYSIVRLALKSEIELVRSWPDSLKTEPEEALTCLAPRFVDIFQKADTALTAQRSAQAARLDHRVRVIEPLIGRVNDVRFKLYGLLVGRAEEKKLSRCWPDGFFKVSERRASDDLEEPVSPAEPINPS